mmetsp:Transcript_11216/g.52057  ORF Transcript_11216/g.52057 Transcript_11216/m.52057 type:complete len:327 (+) Transcript_11216:223-1203(+)
MISRPTLNEDDLFLPRKDASPKLSVLQKAGSCAALLFLSVAATLFAEASKSSDGTYPYNSFMIPCAVEAVKLCVSIVLLVASIIKGDAGVVAFHPHRFAAFSLPAFGYFISNNCMFYIIRQLGPTTFQITNNLKVVATAVLMRVFLGRKLTWLRWKALTLLILGSAVTQLNSENPEESRGSKSAYLLVVTNSIASGAAGVISEKLLKGQGNNILDSIHWQNMQLYFFGLLFGMASSHTSNGSSALDIFDGFNKWAYATVVLLSLSGLLVSFILKYLDNFAKCFVAGLSIIFVAVIHWAVSHETLNIQLVIGIILTCMAIEQYNLPQ